ncbi:MAG TPA: PAS domain S-box protein [Solirubrobacteraceae bacterium]
MPPLAQHRDASALLRAEHAVAHVLAQGGDARALVAAVGEALGWPLGAVWERDADDPAALRCVAVWSAPGFRDAGFAAATRRLRLRVGEGLPGGVLATGRPAWLADLPADLPRACPAARAGLRSAFCFPLGELGAIELFAAAREEADAVLLETLASLGARIGEHLRLEEALHVNEARRRAVVDAAFDCIVTMDATGRITFANQATERTFGYRVEDLIGADLADSLIPPSLREDHRRGLRRYLETGEGAVLDHPLELSALRADGTEFPVEVAIRRLELPGPPLFTGYIRDVTDRRAAETALRRLADDQAALRRVATLVAAGAERDAVFAAVTEEVGRALDAQMASLVRFLGDGTARLVGLWSDRVLRNMNLGVVVPTDGDTVSGRIVRTGRPARVDSYEGLGGQLAEIVRGFGWRAAVGAPVTVEGELWGAVMVSTVDSEPFPPGTEDRIAGFTELIAQALANAEAREQLAASRTRIVAAGDRERRRLERNLHDGAQQRLVGLALTLRTAERMVDVKPAVARAMLREASEELSRALEELRELARGLHPAVLAHRGLGAALESLAARTPLPVDLECDLNARVEPAAEAAAYYVVSEALTNAVKHAGASAVRVSARLEGDRLAVTVADDGRGGASFAAGSGLQGLADRVEALGGRLRVTSPPGAGTVLRAELPARYQSEEEPAAGGGPGGSSRTTGTR